jgi:HlyD family secretion protein
VPKDGSKVELHAAAPSVPIAERVRLRPSARRRTLVVLATVALLMLGAGVSQWIGHGTAQSKYRTAQVTRADVTQSVSANGTLNPVVLVNVGRQVSGTVKKLHVDFNDRVKAGQVLLELDPALLQAQVNQDQANLANAKATLELAQANEARKQDALGSGFDR